MRYYSTQRPVGPGTFPKLPENKVLEVHNFDAKTFCEEIGREAWGYIDFESPLTQEQADNYELIAPGVGCTGCVNETASRDMDCCWNCSRNRRSTSRMSKPFSFSRFSIAVYRSSASSVKSFSIPP